VIITIADKTHGNTYTDVGEEQCDLVKRIEMAQVKVLLNLFIWSIIFLEKLTLAYV
jgi:hypothetical protein